MTGLGTGVVLAWQDRAERFERAEVRLQQDAAEFAGRLSEDMGERVQDVLLLSRLPSFVNAGPAEQRGILGQVAATDASYAWLGVTSVSGVVRASSPSGLLEGVDVSQRPWWMDARGGLFVGDLHEAALLADALRSEDGTVPRFVDIAVPLVGPDDEPVGVLGAHLFWSWAEELRRQQLLLAPKDGRQFLILGATGEVLLPPRGVADAGASPRPVRSVAGGQGRATLEWTDGDHVTGWATAQPSGDFGGLGWRVVARRPAGPLAAEALLLGGKIVAGALLAALAVAAAAWWRVRRATDEIGTIAAAAQQLRDGEPGEMPLLAGTREVAVLSSALRELTEHLAARQRDLEERNRQLAEASRAREHFTMMASHETRTPVTVIKGVLHTMRQHRESLPAETQQQLLDAAWRNAERLERLTSHMLVAAELENGTGERRRPAEPVVPAEFLAKIAPVGVAVEGPADLQVVLDPSLAELTVGNLLDNAAKYGAAPVQVSFELDGDALEVRVRDHGPGVPDEFVGRLFGRHAQASEGLQRTAVGAGLGLWLSRELLQGAGGDLTHVAPEGQGALFVARIPVRQQIAAAGLPRSFAATYDAPLQTP